MTIYDQLLAKAAEWRKFKPTLNSDLSPAETIVEMWVHEQKRADELEALARQVCADARKENP